MKEIIISKYINTNNNNTNKMITLIIVILVINCLRHYFSCHHCIILHTYNENDYKYS